MTERRVLLASVLSALFLALYARVLAGRPAPGNSTRQLVHKTSSMPTAPPGETFIQPIVQEYVVSIESDDLHLEIGVDSGAVRLARLKKFSGASKDSPLVVRSEAPLISTRIDGTERSWKLIKHDRSEAIFESVDQDRTKYYHISYHLDEHNPLIYITLESENTEGTSETNLDLIWTKADQLSDRYNRLEAYVLAQSQQGKMTYKRYPAAGKTIKQIYTNVPRGTALFSLSERYFCLCTRAEPNPREAKLFPFHQGTIGLQLGLVPKVASENKHRYSAVVYLGPRDYFYLKRAGFEEAFPVGSLGQIGLILLSLLGAIAKAIHNYGLAIIVFAGLVTAMTAPFTLTSMRSMKKMQELKPKVDKIMAQHKDDSKRTNQELFALYKEHRVSPLSGCLPMLLQMPIFIALFQAISHFVELRGKTFLWIKDLSLPDRMALIPVSLPLVGKELNALPIIMAIVMYLQTKWSQQGMPKDGAAASASALSGPLMPILFGVMFYQFPAGLVLYWLSNSLFSLLMYRVVFASAKSS